MGGQAEKEKADGGKIILKKGAKMFKWLKSLFARKRKRHEEILQISKKDAKWSRAMWGAEDEADKMENIDFGEAYNFHHDCGDR